MRILHIDPELHVVESVDVALRNVGMVPYHTDDMNDGVDLARHYDFDVIVVEPSFQDPSLVGPVRRLRLAKINMPILVLTRASSQIQRIEALLDAGADDVMSKPFHVNELVARLRAIARRARGHAQSVIAIGVLAIDTSRMQVSLAGMPLLTSRKEYAILELLALRKDSVVTKEMIIDHLYGGRDEPEMKIVDVFICKIRKKLAAASGGCSFIETVWGRGYILPTRPSFPHLAAIGADPVPSHAVN